MIASLLLQAADLPLLSPPLPADWSVLAPLPYMAVPVQAPALSSYVADEIAAGRCAVARPADGHYIVRVDVAALVSGAGVVRRAVPHAIACPTVEQYATGLVLGYARGNLLTRRGAPDLWYRATITFDWRG